MKRIKVSLARSHDDSYDLLIGRDILERACLEIARMDSVGRMIVIADSQVAALHGDRFVNLLTRSGMPAELLSFPAGEASKTMETVLSIATQLLERRADRATALVALGGGVTGDLAGFTASIYMRSVPLIQVPTTLIGQVDSSIGGKTGVDFVGGKNLLGSFYQPRQVIIDLAFLDTLPGEEYRNGLAEVVKYGIIDDLELFEYLETHASAIRAREPEVLQTIVPQCCTIKKGIVEIDEHDRGIRRILNFGHTIGHALEGLSGFALSHGQAVSIGMAVEARIAEQKGHLARSDRERIDRLLDSLGLDRTVPSSMDTKDIVNKIGADKKREGDRLLFVLITRIGVPFINGSVDDRLIEDALGELKA
ncbi:MAG: 3-dehydroquinate synthase [Syntrophales bacterium]|jgi:3-dehydroquinate synthase|nr:3-dehydroquinate synthase [Syntrophales bacterium]MCK9527389.1 3-dehydroquinate synthase [Syntrophales bacterium]MDX9921491.1 3-dehydroquinate synthase [Syntrophales bacterium]